MSFILKALLGPERPLGERIYFAAKRNDLTGLQNLLSGLGNNRTALEWEDAEACTPLCIAAACGHWNVAEMLLKVGSSHRACSTHKDGGTPLHEAVAKAQPPCAMLLFNSGADPFVENRYGESAYDLALRRQNVEFLRMFEKKAAVVAWLAMKVPKNLGISKEWKMHWLVLVVREQSPLVPARRRVLHSQLLIYESHKSSRPKEKLFTDGAYFMAPTANLNDSSWTLVLHTMAAKPTYLCTAQHLEQWRVCMRSCNSTPDATKYMDELAKRVNETYFRALAHSGMQPSTAAWVPPAIAAARPAPLGLAAAGAPHAALAPRPAHSQALAAGPSVVPAAQACCSLFLRSAW